MHLGKIINYAKNLPKIRLVQLALNPFFHGTTLQKYLRGLDYAPLNATEKRFKICYIFGIQKPTYVHYQHRPGHSLEARLRDNSVFSGPHNPLLVIFSPILTKLGQTVESMSTKI